MSQKAIAAINNWIKAENELRKGNDFKCLELKDKFKKKYDFLPQKEQQDVDEYLQSIGG